MASCPECENPLRTVRERGGIYLLCDHCGGRAMTFPQIRRTSGDRFVNDLLRTIHAGTSPSPHICCYCSGPMRQFQLENPPLPLEYCRKCDLIWFRAGQSEAMPEGVLRSTESMVVQVHDYMAQKVDERPEPAAQVTMLDVGWRAAPAVLGFPVEIDREASLRKPWATWILMLITAIISIAAFSRIHDIAIRFGFIPKEAWRDGGLTLVTPFFLHAGWMHLIGNMYFLCIFGPRVENYLGRWRYLILLLVATIDASLLHWIAQPLSTIPGIGASGGIAGVIGFYALRFPRARLGMLVRFRWVTMPSWVALILWLLYQAVLAEMQMIGIGSINAFAHLGGVATGILAWVVWRKLPVTPPQAEADSMK